MNVLITIAFRKESKRLLDKNIKILNGKELYKWTWDIALDWNLSRNVRSEIVLCTDYDILDFGCNVKRPKKLCGDNIPKLDVLRYILYKIEKNKNKIFNTIIDLDVCNPIRTIDHIQEAYQKFQKRDVEVLVSAVKAYRPADYNQICSDLIYGYFTVLPSPLPYSSFPLPSKFYDMNNSIAIMKRDWLLNSNNQHYLNDSVKNTIYEMPEHTRVDIDTEFDFFLVEQIMKKWKVGCKKNDI